jgi:RimJ/RimL family protein N-acetyltransferase
MTFEARMIRTERLELAPLAPDDATELAGALADPALHEFIGGSPPDAGTLRRRYEQMVADPGRDDERWLNWTVRLDGIAIGTVQATLVRDGDAWRADIAWVIGTPWQGRGFASEAARGLVAWLRGEGVDDIRANIHPDHRASEAVAHAAGLVPTDEEADGERVWVR